MATNLTFKEQEKNRLKADQLLNAIEAGLTIAKEDWNKPLTKEELKKIQEKQDKSSPYEPFKSPFKKAQKQQIKPNTILLPKIPKGEVKDPNSEFYKDNIYGLQAHGPGQEDIRDKFTYRTDGVLMIDPKRDGTLRPATRDEEEIYQLQRLQYEENPYAPFPHEHGDDYGLKISPKLAQNVDYGKPTARDKALRPWQREETGGSLRHIPDSLRIQILRDTIPLA